MLAYNLLSQNLANSSSNNNSTSTPVTPMMTNENAAQFLPTTTEPLIQEDTVINTEQQQQQQQQQSTEPPKTMAERLVDVIYLQAVEYNRIKQDKKDRPIADELKDGQQVTALDLLSGHDRSHAHSSRQQRLLLPERLPAGLDPLTVLFEREKRIEERASARLKELEAMTMDDQKPALGYLVNEYYDETVRAASPEKLKFIVQLRSLQLRDKQQKVINII